MSDAKPCFQDEKNLSAPEMVKPDLALRVCAVCGCRHFELSVDPARLGLVVSGM